MMQALAAARRTTLGTPKMVEGSAHETQAKLVARAQYGDLQAFESLYRSCCGRVYALCLRMCGEPAEAEELAQEVFIRAWQKLSSFRGESAFTTWLHRLTVNLVLGRRRSWGRREAREAVLDEGVREVAQAPPAQAGLHLDLERAIRRLPERARTVFVLHDVEGYRHDEIAHMAGMAVGTSKAQLHRARRLLREALSS